MHAKTTSATGSDSTQALTSLALLEGLARVHPWILVVDADRRVTWSSPELAPLLGLDRIRPGSDARQFFARMPRPERVIPLRSRLSGRTHMTSMPIEVCGADGDVRKLDVDLMRIGDGDEEYIVAIGRCRDENPPDPLEVEMLEQLDDSLIALDADGFVRRANAAACRLLGSDEEGLVAQPISALLARRGVPLEILGELFASSSLDDDVEVTLGDEPEGSRRFGVSVANLSSGRRALRLRELPDEADEIAALRRLNEELEHALGALAHDLRSPLAGVLGFSRLLREDYAEQLDETGRHFIDRIERGARSMERLLRDLLELARIGQPGEVPALIDAHALLRQLAADLKPRLEETGIALVLPAGQSGPLYCDRARLYQLFSNLIGNAIQHMGRGGDARIEVQVFERSDHHEIVVSDNGCGVDPAHRDRIFESFQSFGTSDQGESGTGMGLAIVRRIAEKYAGRAWLDSEHAPGASFHVTLPRP